MIKVGKWIAKHKILIIIIGIALLIPSYLGMAATRINYDVLSYLPDTLETVDGQDIMVDQFGMGAFSMIVVEDMELKDVAALKEKIEAVDHVKKVLWYDSVLDVSVPVEMLPKDLREAFFNGDATMMIALFDNTTSSETSMEAVTQIRKITSKNCFVSGMTGIVTDIEAGMVFTGKVVRIMNFGAFVQLAPNKDGMVHISKLSDKRVAKVEDVVNIGDEVTVKVAEVDKMGRINLTMRPEDMTADLEKLTRPERRERSDRPERRDDRRGGRRDDRRERSEKKEDNE